LATIVARESNPAQTTMLSYGQVKRTSDDRVATLVLHLRNGRTRDPFVEAAVPAHFAEHGYLSMRDSSHVFAAPTADVLLDQSFAITHCFRMRAADAEHAGQIGIAFAPIPSRLQDTLVDVRGVIWLDAIDPRLRSLDFAYTALEPAAISAKAGGHVQFRTMENGVSFIDDWFIQTPILEPGPRPDGFHRAASVSTRRSERVDWRVARVVRDGGNVLDAQWADGTQWHAASSGVRGTVRERDGWPVASARVAIAASNDTTKTDSTGGFALIPLPPGTYTLVVRDSTGGNRHLRETRQDVQIQPSHVVDVTIVPHSER
jgi:hypothetical protein